MFGTTPLILIVLPLLFQLIFDTIAILKPIFLRFKAVLITNIVLQIVLSIVSFYIGSYNFSKYFEQNPTSTRCGMPLIGLATSIIFSALVLLIVIIIQYFVKRLLDRKTKL